MPMQTPEKCKKCEGTGRHCSRTFGGQGYHQKTDDCKGEWVECSCSPSPTETSWEERWEHHKGDLWGLAIMGHTMNVAERADVIASVKAFIRTEIAQAERRGIERALGAVEKLQWDIHGCQCAKVGKSDMLSAIRSIIPTEPAV